MHTEDLDDRGSTTFASTPTQDHPRVAAPRSTRFLHDSSSPIERNRRGSLRWAYSRGALTVLYAVLAVLLGLLVDLLEDPPTVVTAIIVATFFGALIANDVSLRRRR